MYYVLFDGPERPHLLPFTFTRSVADLRLGILTLRQKWERHLGGRTATITQPYLARQHPPVQSVETLYINPTFLPSPALVARVKALRSGRSLVYEEQVVAFRASAYKPRLGESLKRIPCGDLDLVHLRRNWDFIALNARAIREDFSLLTRGRSSQPVDSSNRLWGEAHQVFLEEGAQVRAASLNAECGPIYIGRSAQVMEGALIRGPFAMGDHARVRMGAKLYGATSTGPHVTLGGEVKNALIFGYSNKAHEGYLGDSVLGAWCNLGAGTDNSNLKNTYGAVRVWNYALEAYEETGLQFCGLFMGDHSRCSIHSMFNTGTVVGVSCNLFGAGFHEKFTPSFRWGRGRETSYRLDKAVEAARAMMHRRERTFTEADRLVFQHIFEAGL